MNIKIILATSGLGDAEILFKSVYQLIDGNTPLIVEASGFDRDTLTAFPDTRTMQEATDLMFSNTQQLEELCNKRQVTFLKRPYSYNDFIKRLISESRFADMIICSFRALSAINERNYISFSNRAMIGQLECPLLVVPENPAGLMPNDLFLYDRSADCIHAIKSFTYLFPHRCDGELLVYGNPLQSADNSRMNAWLSAHFHAVKWLEALPENGRYNLVASAFGKSMLSEPMFIDHARYRLFA